jgi:hypothetical protein
MEQGIGPNNERNRARHQRKTQANWDYVTDLKARSVCADCGTKENLTFDHLSGFRKLGNISSMVSRVTPTKLKREIAKCRIVCLPCHQRRENFRGIANHKIE